MDQMQSHGVDPMMMMMMGRGHPGMGMYPTGHTSMGKEGKKKFGLEKESKLDTSNFVETNGDDFKPDIQL